MARPTPWLAHGADPTFRTQVADPRVQLALNAARLFTWEITPATGAISYSPNARQILGYPPGSVIHDGVGHVVPEDRDALRAAYESAIKSDVAFDIDYRITDPSSSAVRWLRSQGQQLQLDPDGPALLVGVTQDITERKRTEAVLQASEERYQTLFTSIDEGFCVIHVLFDEQGTPVDYVFEELNPAFERQTGLTNAFGKRMKELSPDHEEHWFQTYGEVALTGKPVRFIQHAYALGDRWFDVYAFPLKDVAPHRVGVLFTDISERRRVDEAIRLSGERLHKAIEIETVGIVFFRQDGTIFDANNAFLRMSGYSREDLQQGIVRLDTLTPPEWRPALQHAAEELLTQGRNTPYEKEYLRKDGSRWWGLFAATQLDDDEAVKFIVDISAVKRAESERSRLATIVENSSDAIIGIDTENVITDWNRGAETIFGYTSREAVGQTIQLLIPDDQMEEWQDSVNSLRNGEETLLLESVHLNKQGRRLDVELTLSPIKGPSGRIDGIASVARDATVRKRMERAQQDFLAMASHDLRTPMTVLRAQAQLMRRRKVYDERGVTVMLEQTRRMERLVADLQDAAQLDAGQIELMREDVDACALIRDAVDRARSQTQKHRIETGPMRSPTIAQWDRDRIGQVLDNLLSNAIKYSPDGGRIVVSCEVRDDNARISVADSGVGIPHDVQQQLFERFYRADKTGVASGLGLGLYITQMLVLSHGGRIDVESTPGAGSTFTVVLPLRAAEAATT